MTRRLHENPSRATVETSDERRRRQQQAVRSQLATPRPAGETNPAASALAPLALIGALLVVAGMVVWILFSPRPQTAYGSVSSVDGETIAVETLDGPVERFRIGEQTVRPPALRPGDPIVVHYRELDGSKVAFEIAALERSGAGEPSPAPSAAPDDRR
jgi:hypothetical protein